MGRGTHPMTDTNKKYTDGQTYNMHIYLDMNTHTHTYIHTKIYIHSFIQTYIQKVTNTRTDIYTNVPTNIYIRETQDT
jgi:hypothetical protein